MVTINEDIETEAARAVQRDPNTARIIRTLEETQRVMDRLWSALGWHFEVAEVHRCPELVVCRLLNGQEDTDARLVIFAGSGGDVEVSLVTDGAQPVELRDIGGDR